MTHRKTQKKRAICRRERWGGGVGRSQIIRRRESLVLYKSLNTDTLWVGTYIPISMNNEICTYGHIVGGIDADSGHIGARAGSDVRDPIRKNASKNRRANATILALNK